MIGIEKYKIVEVGPAKIWGYIEPRDFLNSLKHPLFHPQKHIMGEYTGCIFSILAKIDHIILQGSHSV